jgi:hypothetical protein
MHAGRIGRIERYGDGSTPQMPLAMQQAHNVVPSGLYAFGQLMQPEVPAVAPYPPYPMYPP